MIHTVRILALALLAGACGPDTSEQIGGETQWIDVGGGRLKAQVFKHADVVDRPTLVLVLHGDLPDPPPDYQYIFARMLTLGSEPEAWAALRPLFPADWTDEQIAARRSAVTDALGAEWSPEKIVAAGILRPGYADSSGDRSSGDMGMAVADNYTAQVVDAVAIAARELAAMHDASAVVLVGHSGGGAIAANVLGRPPDVADGALLVGCGCDPEAWRARMRVQQPSRIWDEPNESLMPLSLVDGVATGTRVRLLVGEQDDVALPQDSRRFAAALEASGIDAELTVAPGLGHNILMTPNAFRELDALVREVGPYIPEAYLAPQFEAAADAPSRVVVADEREPGERLVVSGRVLDGGRPVAGASIYVFQTDIEGRYALDRTGNDAEENPRLHGAMRSDADGHYEFATVRPGHYGGNPAHVHYVVRAAGYKPRLLDLWFEDDPELAARRSAGRPEVPLNFPRGAVAIRPVARDAGGIWRTTRDIEMVPEY
jgi:predicted esterase